MPVYSARSNSRGGDGGPWRSWPVFFLLLILGAGISPCPALAGSPAIDGTPTKATITTTTSFTTSFPAGFSSANSGDCCLILYCGNQTLSTSAGCAASGSGWTPFTFPGWGGGNAYTAEILTHVYASGDTAPTCNLSASGSGSRDLLCYKSSNGCAFAAGPTQHNGSASTNVSGSGITGTSGDAHLFFTCAAGSGTATFSSYSDSLVQEVAQSDSMAPRRKLTRCSAAQDRSPRHKRQLAQVLRILVSRPTLRRARRRRPLPRPLRP